MLDHKILQSVIEITKHRDLDSMESSLVTTLAELLPTIGICILKSIEEKNTSLIEEVISLSIDHEKSEPFSWSVDSTIIAIDEHVAACMNNSETTTYIHEKGFRRHMFPINNGAQTIGCLIIDSNEDLSSHMILAEGLVMIYENYMVIFNESERDKLTGLFNRRTYDSKLSKLFKAQQLRKQQYTSISQLKDRRNIEQNNSAWLIIIDIDHFKRVNDNYGHVFGDEVILTISQKMKDCFRNSDLLFRIGGEEFVILLEPAPQKIAENLIEKFRESVEEHPFSQIGTVTVSAGYTKITEKSYPPAVLEDADKALYYAKENGRNCSYNYEKLIAQGKINVQKKGGIVDLF